MFDLVFKVVGKRCVEGTRLEPSGNSGKLQSERDSAESLRALTEKITRETDVSGLLHPALEVIREYDEKNQSGLFHTLDVYLQNDCNAQHCGRLLFLHRNSLVYRIHRIQEIAGIDLSDPDERSYLRLSFLLWKALQ